MKTNSINIKTNKAKTIKRKILVIKLQNMKLE